jgi:hypothetical protein
LAAKHWKEAPDLSIVGCPIDLLLAIDFLASERQKDSFGQAIIPSQSGASKFKTMQTTLASIQDFDVQNWAQSMSGAIPTTSTISARELERFCRIWKLAAEMYAIRIMHSYGYYYSAEPKSIMHGLINNLITQYEFLMHEDTLMKCLIWPAFIAGAESTHVKHREWVMKMLEKVWRLTLCANAKYAMSVLRSLWVTRDSGMYDSSVPGDGTRSWDWISELAAKDDRWLFF